MDFLKTRIKAAADAARGGDGEQCRRILDHAVAEDPGALNRIAAAVEQLPHRGAR